MKNNKILFTLGSKIKKRRKLLNMTQEELAQRCDFDRTYISLLERGKRNPSYINLIRICEGLELTICKLLKDN